MGYIKLKTFLSKYVTGANERGTPQSNRQRRRPCQTADRPMRRPPRGDTPLISHERPTPPTYHFWTIFRVAVDSRLYSNCWTIPCTCLYRAECRNRPFLVLEPYTWHSFFYSAIQNMPWNGILMLHRRCDISQPRAAFNLQITGAYHLRMFLCKNDDIYNERWLKWVGEI